MMPLDWSEHAKLERGAALPVDECSVNAARGPNVWRPLR